MATTLRAVMVVVVALCGSAILETPCGRQELVDVEW
jgi:hypothetical protein